MENMIIEGILPPKELVRSVLDREITDLPAFPVVALKILTLIRQDTASAADIAKLIESDPAVTAKILRMVNSAAFGLRNRVSSVKEGIAFLGLSAIQRLALQVTLFEQIIRPTKTVIFDRVFFWQHCLAVAGLSQALAVETGYQRPEEAYVAGLLHDIGKTILDGYGCISYGDFLKHLMEPDNLQIETEKKVIGISHDDIGAYYCASWNLPETLIYAVKFHHLRYSHLNLPEDTGKLLAIVCLANFLAWTQGLGSAEILRHPVLLPEVETHMDLNLINFPVIMDLMDQEMRRTADLYQFSFPSLSQFRMNLLRANMALARLNTVYHYGQDHSDTPLNPATEALAKTAASPDVIIRNTMNAIQEDFGYDRLFIFKIDRDKRCLIPVYCFDFAKKSPDLSSAEFPITRQSEKIIHCLRQLRPVILKRETKEEERVLTLLKTKEAGLIPFSHNNRLLGVVGLDNYHSSEAISLSDLEKLSPLAQELGVAFDHSLNMQAVRLKEHVDPLTKLYSHHYMTQTLTGMFKNREFIPDKSFLGIIEIDLFKEFNSRFGVLEGESVIKLVAGVLTRISRSRDFTGRCEADRFMVILTQMSREKALLYAERLRKQIEKMGDLLLKRFPDHNVTVSMGLATANKEIRTQEQLITAAEKALMHAHTSGGNQVVIQQPAG